jgi:CRISPR type III-B/RAMP module-associated protein Cmr3
MTAAQCFWLDLEPADTLFFRDHGSRRPGVDNWAGSVPPSPLTLFGAIGSWLMEGLGVDFAAFKKAEEPHDLLGTFNAELRELPWSIAGPFWGGEQGTVYFPAPASSYFNKEQNEYVWLIPSEEHVMLSGLPEEIRPLCFASGDGKDFTPAQGLIENADLERFLQNGMPSIFSHEEEEQFFCAEKRFGIGINENTFAADAENGMLFVTPRMRVKQGNVFSVQVRFAAEDAHARLEEEVMRKTSGVAFFGGERGRVKISFRKNEPLIAAPDRAELAQQGRFLLYLCTPALFAEG